MMIRPKLLTLACFSALFASACQSSNTPGHSSTTTPSHVPPGTRNVDPKNPHPSNSAPSSASSSGHANGRRHSTDVLLFNGIGISEPDWQTTEEIVRQAGFSYQLVNSGELSAMSLDQIADFGVIIVPGGHGDTITDNISDAARIRVRQAVRDRGVNFLGFCAGAWVAVGPEPAANTAASYGFALVTGSFLNEYLPGGQEPEAAMVPLSFAGGAVRQLVWWGGPSTPNWKNGVIARYSTGEPAISETWAGKGYVVISGVHPEAPASWRLTAGDDPDGLDYDITVQLINAALNQRPFPAF